MGKPIADLRPSSQTGKEPWVTKRRCLGVDAIRDRSTLRHEKNNKTTKSCAGPPHDPRTSNRARALRGRNQQGNRAPAQAGRGYSEGPPEPYLSEAGHPQPNHARRTGTHENQNPSCGLVEMQAPALVVAFTCAPPRWTVVVAQLKRFRRT